MELSELYCVVLKEGEHGGVLVGGVTRCGVSSPHSLLPSVGL